MLIDDLQLHIYQHTQLSLLNPLLGIMNDKTISETWILPIAVLFVIVVYSAMATVFYNRN